MIYLNGVLMPITPNKIDMKINNKNKSIDLASGQEINIIKDPGLTTVAIDLLFPSEFLPFAKYDDGFKPPQYFLRELDDMKTKSFQFIVLRPGYNTNLTVTLEGYRILEDAKEGRDIKVSIDLKQYIHYGTRTITIDRPEIEEDEDTPDVIIIQTETRPETRPDIGDYIVQEGDTFLSIAKKLLGDDKYWKLLSVYNGIKNVNRLPVGTVLKIPYKFIEDNT